MPKQPNTKNIGIFIIAGIAFLAVVLLASFGSKFVSNSWSVVMYFNESVMGLNVGSPVVFNGVKIGQVSNIMIIRRKDQKLNIAVVAEIYKDTRNGSGVELGDFDDPKFVDNLIAKGLRARLANQSILTGQKMIEFAILPNSKAELHKTQEEYDDDSSLEIPTVLSPAGILSEGLQDLKLKENMQKFRQILDTIDTQIIPTTQKLLSNANDVLESNKGTFTATLVNFNETLISINRSAKSLKALTDYLEQHPEALISGKRGE